ncbi:restriction endonuclease subunit S [Edwardsiella anguillarum]|uniref:restriction endonuclease subunit S n=1 Tax=Edwardsiella anguillarum TaxID=1821960 RepID=UPI0024B6C671|nr:restriction endonuclease subunit S [Edwardsiella anguillarum]WHP78918.1 restriction endonuclease subunit S [Edwardsiella anguillarum]WHQ16324.1 restriction endonuclease subunit S [Edwardsiella anguillarum]WHQ19857.1 restriction endonuclease subunit S [Edwardsiella anguillarum]WHQ23380.1 restriction endonuclease subunit S [Edwardsiella anguillarum]WHQ26953.1 restriction endonuclease subunit S [Edwardsiella anguillarum]
MGSKWIEVKLSDLGEVARGRSRHRPRYAEHLYGGNYPFIQTGDVKASNGRINSHQQTYSEAGLAQSRLWPKNTMCITIAANIAETGVLQYPACFPDSIIGFIADENKSDVYFIEYLFRKLRKDIQHQASGSVQDNINLQTIERLRFNIPSVNEQRKIAVFLNYFEDKITLNRQINQTLEQMAQALFKSWFVDFDPVVDNALDAGFFAEHRDLPEALLRRAEQRKIVRQQPDFTPLPAETRQLFPAAFEACEEPSLGLGGWVPQGWKTKTLGEITIELRRGISPKYTDEDGVLVINQKCIRNHELSFDIARKHNSALRSIAGRELNIGDVLVNSTGVGTLGRIAQVTYLQGATVIDSHVTVVRVNDTECPIYTFGQLMLSMEASIERLGEGSTGQTELSRKVLSEQYVILPPLKLTHEIERTFQSIAEKQSSARNECINLSKLRDTLLPKLISGELRLSDDGTLADGDTDC